MQNQQTNLKKSKVMNDFVVKDARSRKTYGIRVNSRVNSVSFGTEQSTFDGKFIYHLN